jgi:O-acetylserine/cysteine efflux transporter
MSESAPASKAATEVAGRDLAILVFLNVIWGFNLVASKIGVHEFPPVFFTALRFAIVIAVVFRFLKRHPGEMTRLLWAAFLAGPIAFALLFIGIAHVENVANVAVASQLGVPFTTLLSVWLLGEQIHWRRKLGIFLAFAGVAIISFDPQVFNSLFGLLLVVASALVGALGVIMIKQLRDVRPLELQAWVSSAGVLVLLPLSLATESGQWEAIRHATWHGWAALAFTAVAASLVAHTTWYYLVGKYPVTGLSAVTLLTPIFGIAFCVAILGDVLTPKMIFGSVVTLLGVLIVLMRDRKLVDTGT